MKIPDRAALRIEKDRHVIASMEEWFRHAPPKKRELHWVAGRSAMELARTCLEAGFPAIPYEIDELLASHPGLGRVRFSVAYPEHRIALDHFRGEPRNADLASIGEGRIGPVGMTLEAKADEPYGTTIGAARASVKDAPRSNLPRRIAALGEALLGHSGPEIDHLRYQLLHGAAATLIFARQHGAAAAVFVVLEFHGPSCKPENLARNAHDFDTFVDALSTKAITHTVGGLRGPFMVPGGEFVPSGMTLFIGKVIRVLR